MESPFQFRTSQSFLLKERSKGRTMDGDRLALAGEAPSDLFSMLRRIWWVPAAHTLTGTLSCHDWRRQVLLYATPQELLEMEERDHAGLMRRIKQALEHVRDMRRLVHASMLQTSSCQSRARPRRSDRVIRSTRAARWTRSRLALHASSHRRCRGAESTQRGPGMLANQGTGGGKGYVAGR